MKFVVCSFFLLVCLTLTLGERDSSLGGMIDNIKNVFVKIMGGEQSPFGQFFERALEMFDYPNWRERIVKFLEEKSDELSKRGQQEFDDAVNDLNILKNDPTATKEDYKQVLEKLKEESS
ncbi:uncharacterized protein CDAR_39421 [Caerostris darwini]|uniref:Uncharacterized protein n=1 Tax=Caerostris darwini TaxID=1538125 RepID=A0AAV4U6A3_9ARAC|nr:uncharacterized protein CDAR_39421 [Caerostris darwini]